MTSSTRRFLMVGLTLLRAETEHPVQVAHCSQTTGYF